MFPRADFAECKSYNKEAVMIFNNYCFRYNIITDFHFLNDVIGQLRGHHEITVSYFLTEPDGR